jgi:hypothetical protein
MPTVSGSGHVVSVGSGVTSSGYLVIQQGELLVLSGGTALATSANFGTVDVFGVATHTAALTLIGNYSLQLPSRHRRHWWHHAH